MKTHTTPTGRGSILPGGRAVTVDRLHSDRLVLVTSLAACPDCGAQIGEPCTRLNGNPGSTSHRARRRLALRAERAAEAEYDPTAAAWLARIKPGARATVRRRARLTLRALAAQLELNYDQLRDFESGRRRALGPEGARYITWLRSQMEATR